MYVKNLSPANQLSSLKKVNFSGAFQWFCIGSSPWPHLWSFSRMTITDHFIKERSDQHLPYHNLSAILSCGRQFEASYIKYVPRNWRAQSFHDAALPRQYSMGANFRKFRSKTFGPTGKVSKKRFRLVRWTTFPGRIGWNFVWMDRAPWFKNILSHSLEASRLLLLFFRDNLVPRVYALPTKKALGRQMGEGGPKGRQPSSLLVIVVDGFHSDVIKL